MPERVTGVSFAFIRLFVGGGIFFSLHAFFVREKIAARRDYIQLLLCSFFVVCLKMPPFLEGLRAYFPL